MRLSLYLVLFAAFVASVVAPAGASIIDVERGVLADSRVRSPGAYIPASDLDFRRDFGNLDLLASAEASLPGVEGIARASQISQVSSGSIDFWGTTTIGGFAASSETFGDHQAESSLHLFLDVEAQQSYSIEGLLSVASSAAGDSYASFQLWEVAGASLFSAEVSFEDSREIRTSVILMPGISYELLVLVRSAGTTNLETPSVSGQAGASVAMTAVPEPGSAMLMIVGLSLLGGRARGTQDRSIGIPVTPSHREA